MLAKRIIPCLDVRNGITVKGIHFENLIEVGAPAEMGEKYAEMGADELVYLDVTATHEKRNTVLEWVEEIARRVNIPFTVGGGISTVADVEILLSSGADKVSVNSAAVRRPELISELAKRFGEQCVVVAIDSKQTIEGNRVYLNGGRVATTLDTVNWAKEAQQRGAGEILLTSMDHDGVKNGFAIELITSVTQTVKVPVIASGGGGQLAHFADVLTRAGAAAALAASIFHFGEISISTLKDYLWQQGITIRRVNF